MARTSPVDVSAVPAEKLRSTIEDMDAIQQGCTKQLIALAKLSRLALLSEGGPGRACLQETLAEVLGVMVWIASDLQNLLNCEAEEVGCNHSERDAHQAQGAAHGHA